MTILAQYEPLKVLTPATGTIFSFECVGQDAIEIWMETATATPGLFTRVQLQPQFYSIYLDGAPPSYSGGLIAFNVLAIPDTVYQLSIERNTKITQLCDFSNFNPFHMDLIEFSLDKLTMIIQEIAFRKCNIAITLPIDQTLTFNMGDVLYTTMIDFALDKLIAYCLEMVSSGEDCKNDLERV